ncbi:glycogen synthase [Pedobacter sp. BS3]|uniref:glycogen synthase n=1 Tax=Pedobacter sp. BS3 TaxID=2567937 RepID=UPI0011ED4D20|nr:glycogen/starch synthase [Pedobacter sp. BS3]TZF83057.1 glycogen synthase [Pedobacter sp. BS3]
MEVIHFSAECYPVAKVGGLGDVVGALPKYQCLLGIDARVVMPYYERSFVQSGTFDVAYEDQISLGNTPYTFHILKERENKLGFELYVVHIPGLLDRTEVYGYPDETEQFVAFQLAALQWLSKRQELPDILHCHDHHSGLIPFLASYSKPYERLKTIPTICTIHNGQYQGWMGWDKLHYLPDIDLSKTGLLDWGGCINPLAASIKCCWAYTTVSESYLQELHHHSNGLEFLFELEGQKGYGILNGIDTDVWNPQTDTMIVKKYNQRTVLSGKTANKQALCSQFNLDADKPLITFIGRLVGEKGADLLPEIIFSSLTKYPGEVNFLVLGSGEQHIEHNLLQLAQKFTKHYNVYIGYNEALSHQIYAGADFLLMPSRVEPCGLNQLYALRYGTVPVVRSTGGLKDTVIDMQLDDGYGICFDDASVQSVCYAIDRAVVVHADHPKMQLLRRKMMGLDYSWKRSANQYIQLYQSFKSK